MTSVPRGIRNHNPGNIDRTGEKWQGMAADQSGDKRFVVFTAPEWGIRALAKVLRNYGKKYNIRTVQGVISRWAPANENDTAAYVAQVARAIGVKPGDSINLEAPSVLLPLVTAIIRHENGQQPYAEAVIREGIRRAFV